jgi:type VI secretion system secreted protein Hcp
MSLNAYLRITGSVQGEIKGSVMQKGKEGSIFVLAASHDLIQPGMPAVGAAPGKPQHTPYKIIKETDRSTPMLYKAMMDQETLSECRIDFFRQTGNVVIVQNVYSVKLINARLVGIRFEMPHAKKPEGTSLNEFEEIALVYDQIEWQWHVGNISASAHWQ